MLFRSDEEEMSRLFQEYIMLPDTQHELTALMDGFSTRIIAPVLEFILGKQPIRDRFLLRSGATETILRRYHNWGLMQIWTRAALGGEAKCMGHLRHDITVALGKLHVLQDYQAITELNRALTLIFVRRLEWMTVDEIKAMVEAKIRADLNTLYKSWALKGVVPCAKIGRAHV